MKIGFWMMPNWTSKSKDWRTLMGLMERTFSLGTNPFCLGWYQHFWHISSFWSNSRRQTLKDLLQLMSLQPENNDLTIVKFHDKQNLIFLVNAASYASFESVVDKLFTFGRVIKFQLSNCSRYLTKTHSNDTIFVYKMNKKKIDVSHTELETSQV